MKQERRKPRGFALFETTTQDIRYAVRMLCKSRGFTITSVAILALAIGANTAMFSVLNAVLFRPLPYRNPDQLAMLWTDRPAQNDHEGRSAYWNVEQWEHQSHSFVDMAVYDPASATLTDADRAERIGVARISPNFFSLLGVQPLHGRMFSTLEAEQRQRLVLISYPFWQTRFAGGEAIGESIEVDGQTFRIIGILPDGFQFAQLKPEIWEPYTLFPDWQTRRTARGAGSWFVVGRLRPDATLEQAQAEMSAIARRLDEQLPLSERHLGISIVPLSLQLAGPKTRLDLWMLTYAVFCVLLIAATNVASLSLARNAGREREIAIRAALGASRGRILRQLLAESLALGVLSGILGLAVAVGGIRVILTYRPANLARLNEIGLDPLVLGCALALCLLTGVLVGLAPAVTSARRTLRHSGAERGTAVAGGLAARGMRRILVVAQFALAIVLLAAACLLLRSLWSIENVDPGFRARNVLSIQLATPVSMSTAQRASFYSRVLERVQSVPGVKSTGLIEDLFIGSRSEQTVTTEQRSGTVSQRLQLRSDEVTPGFFDTLVAPLLRGRFFSAEDAFRHPPVVIVNETMARRLWAGRDPLGQRVKFDSGNPGEGWFTVIGVVKDIHRQGLEKESIAQMFEPLGIDPPRLATLLVRTSLDDPLKLAGTVRTAVQQVDKSVPLYDMATLENRLGAFLTQRRFQTSLLIGFAAIALLMAAIGIYGLIQYSVAIRTREIGIRMAVGAQAGEIFRMIIGEGLKLSLAGLALGLVGAIYAGRAGRSLLFGVKPTDPGTFIAVSVSLVAAAVAACYFPARRAMKVEPLAALRQE